MLIPFCRSLFLCLLLEQLIEFAAEQLPSQDAVLLLALLLTWPSIGPTLLEVISYFLQGPPQMTMGSVLFLNEDRFSFH